MTRWPNPSNPGALPAPLSLAGALLLFITGWLGGELVERLGVGVDEGRSESQRAELADKSLDSR